MHLKILGGILVVVAALALTAGSASAYYYMTFQQARSETAEFASESCGRDCIGSRVGPCKRRAAPSISCVMIQRYAFIAPESAGIEEFDCHTLVHWGVNRRGVIVLRHAGKPHCFAA